MEWLVESVCCGRRGWILCSSCSPPFGLLPASLLPADLPSCLPACQAGERSADVYMGVDCWGRNTFGGGRFTCDAALDASLRQGLSGAAAAGPSADPRCCCCRGRRTHALCLL